MTNTATLPLLHIDSFGIAHLNPSCEEFNGIEIGAIRQGSPALAGALHCADCD
jgi:hypothetical protein